MALEGVGTTEVSFTQQLRASKGVCKSVQRWLKGNCDGDCYLQDPHSELFCKTNLSELQSLPFALEPKWINKTLWTLSHLCLPSWAKIAPSLKKKEHKATSVDSKKEKSGTWDLTSLPEGPGTSSPPSASWSLLPLSKA